MATQGKCIATLSLRKWKLLWYFRHKDLGWKRKTVWLLPREVSRITKFIIDHGPKVIAELIGTDYRRSLLLKGESEISYKESVSALGAWINLLLLESYKQLTEELYLEAKEEVILGVFFVPLHMLHKYLTRGRKPENKKKILDGTLDFNKEKTRKTAKNKCQTLDSFLC